MAFDQSQTARPDLEGVRFNELSALASVGSLGFSTAQNAAGE